MSASRWRAFLAVAAYGLVALPIGLAIKEHKPPFGIMTLTLASIFAAIAGWYVPLLLGPDLQRTPRVSRVILWLLPPVLLAILNWYPKLEIVGESVILYFVSGFARISAPPSGGWRPTTRSDWASLLLTVGALVIITVALVWFYSYCAGLGHLVSDEPF